MHKVNILINKKKIIIDENSKIKDAIKLLEKSSSNILFLIKKKKLTGVFQDNDLRRAIIYKKNLNDKIITISQKKPKYIYEDQLSVKKIDEIFTKYNCEAIPVLKNDKTIVDIIFYKNHFKQQNKINIPKAIIMAGGKGQRLRPITKIIPKPLAKFKKKPIIDYILYQLIKNDIKNIFISVNYKKEKIISHLNKKNNNLNIRYLIEKRKLGTAGALNLVKKYINKNENIIVINGDLIFDVNIKNIIDYHIKNKFDITVVTKDIGYQIPYGLVKTKKNLLNTLDEKPKIMARVMVGIYIINSKCLKNIKNGYLDMPNFLSSLIKKKNKVGYYPIYENYYHITSPNDLK